MDENPRILVSYIPSLREFPRTKILFEILVALESLQFVGRVELETGTRGFIDYTTGLISFIYGIKRKRQTDRVPLYFIFCDLFINHELESLSVVR